MTAALVNIKNIYPGQKSYVAITENNQAVGWGMALYGGGGVSFKGSLTFKSQTESGYEARNTSTHYYIRQAASVDLSGVLTVFPSWGVYTFIKYDGTVVTTGMAQMGGYNPPTIAKYNSSSGGFSQYKISDVPDYTSTYIMYPDKSPNVIVNVYGTNYDIPNTNPYGFQRGIAYKLPTTLENTMSRPFVEWKLEWTLPQVNDNYTLTNVTILEKPSLNGDYHEYISYNSPFNYFGERKTQRSDRFIKTNEMNKLFTANYYYKVRLTYDHDERDKYDNYNSFYLFSDEVQFVSRGLGAGLLFDGYIGDSHITLTNLVGGGFVADLSSNSFGDFTFPEHKDISNVEFLVVTAQGGTDFATLTDIGNKKYKTVIYNDVTDPYDQSKSVNILTSMVAQKLIDYGYNHNHTTNNIQSALQNSTNNVKSNVGLSTSDDIELNYLSSYRFDVSMAVPSTRLTSIVNSLSH